MATLWIFKGIISTIKRLWCLGGEAGMYNLGLGKQLFSFILSAFKKWN